MANNKNRQQRSIAPILLLLALLVLGLILAFMMNGMDVALLNPKGLVANEQSKLLVISTLIILGFGLPVIFTLYYFAWKYREGNQKSAFAPNTQNSKLFLAFAWGGPLATVILLATLMIPATHDLAPQKSIQSTEKQLTIQVVALSWKWLFIYPEQNVASVNFAQIPVDTPVRFELTADEAPMSAFWIPHLGGMLYAMTGHINPLNLVAQTAGDYPGSSAELNGDGFAGMKFTARASSREDFDAWVATTKQSDVSLNNAEYKKLLEPSHDNKAAFYTNLNPDLYGDIISKYNGGHKHSDEHEGHGSY